MLKNLEKLEQIFFMDYLTTLTKSSYAALNDTDDEWVGLKWKRLSRNRGRFWTLGNVTEEQNA